MLLCKPYLINLIKFLITVDNENSREIMKNVKALGSYAMSFADKFIFLNAHSLINFTFRWPIYSARWAAKVSVCLKPVLY